MTRAGFAAWLDALPPAARVGTADECPVKRFFRELGYPQAYVGAGDYSLGLYDAPQRMEGKTSWMAAFTAWADEETMEGSGWGDISAAAAGEALARIEA